MIAGIFHQGSGLGNQLHRYVATRVLAADKGYRFGMLGCELFKGRSFMDLEFGELVACDKRFEEKKVVENAVDIRGYDPEFNFIEDNTIIDGEFQDERYFQHRLEDIRQWLKTDIIAVPDDLCVIGFRGGEYSLYPDLFLTQDYWDEAIHMMRLRNHNMRFHVVTDDPETARKFFPYPITHEIGNDWRMVRYAENAIIANSSFYILPRLMHGGFTIAPRYWARRNTKVWALPQNYYKSFTYI